MADDSENKELVQDNKPSLEKNKGKRITPILRGKKKEGSFFPIVFIMLISFSMAIYWDKIPAIKDSVHAVLDPSAGALLKINLTIGMLLIVFVITLITTVIQKYTTDQEALKDLKKEQKSLQEEINKNRGNPEKIRELSKKQLAFFSKTFKLNSRSILFTGIPFILFFRWFYDTFNAMGQPLFFGFLSWFWFYLILTMVFSSILRKWMKVA